MRLALDAAGVPALAAVVIAVTPCCVGVALLLAWTGRAMRYFTLDVYNHWYEHYDDKALKEVFDQYTRYLAGMKGVLPDEALALAGLRGVDDGLLHSVQHDRGAEVLRLTMRCGDLRVGYYDLVLLYEGASISSEHDRVLAWVARSTRGHRTCSCEVAYHEVDRADDGRIEHRLLFHPGAWFAIRCDRLRWEQIATPDRRLPRCRDRYPGGPPAADPRGGQGDA